MYEPEGCVTSVLGLVLAACMVAVLLAFLGVIDAPQGFWE